MSCGFSIDGKIVTVISDSELSNSEDEFINESSE